MSSEDSSGEAAPTNPAPQAAELNTNDLQPKQDDSRTESEHDVQINGNGSASQPNNGTLEPPKDDPKSEGSSTYSADTVAAISSLLHDESPLFKSEDGDNSPSTSTLATSNIGQGSTNHSELTISDRATAIISVYKDYLYEGLGGDNAQTVAVQNSPAVNQPLLVREGDGQLKLLEGDLDNIQIDRSGLLKGGEENLQHGHEVLTPQDLRKEGIKLATLEKFCAEGDKYKKKKHKKKKKKKDSSGDSKTSGSTSISTLSRSTASKSANSKSSAGKQTAASTTAAFRLKADVALRTVSNATTTVIHKATVASRTASEVIKTKYRDSTVDVNYIQEEINNDYDFKSYDGNEGLAPPSTGLEDYMEDMEYGISPLGDKGLVFRSDGDHEDDMSFRDICEDLGVTRATHPNLDRYGEKSKYKYAIFRSKKFKKSLCYGGLVLLVGIVAVSLASAITKGFHKSPPLPDYEADEEWREHQKEDWEMEHGALYTGYNNVAVVVPDVANVNNVEDAMPPPPISNHDESNVKEETISKHDKLFQDLSAAYRPIWFDRSTGWKGQTYHEAFEFCNSYSDYIPCPYNVYCPRNNELLSGVMEHEGESWAAVVNMNNEWVQVGTDNPCELYTQKYGKPPDWGNSGQNNEMITRHIMCCRSHPYQEGSVWNTNNQPGSAGNDYVHKPIVPVETLPDHATDTDEDTGNVVESETTEIEADDTESTEIEILNPPVTNHQDIASIEGLSSMTEWEMQVQKVHHPAWFSDELGWKGTTYSDAEAFCNSIPHFSDTLELCPLQAYCPNGPTNEKPLYLQMDAFKGEQWAPVTGDEWVMIGMLNKDPSSTCRTYAQLHHKEPSWGFDGSHSEIKKHILCCEPVKLATSDNLVTSDNSIDEESSNTDDDTLVEMVDWNPPGSGDKTSSEGDVLVETLDWDPNANSASQESSTSSGSGGESTSSQTSNVDSTINAIYTTFDPIWLDSSNGWNGGSHDDALNFCKRLVGSRGKKMELCPYAAYCPHGPSNPIISWDAYGADFNKEGEQWAPVYGQKNHWVLITPEGGNLARSCLSHVQLYDEMPSWGLDDSNKEMKKHILCCSPLQ